MKKRTKLAERTETYYEIFMSISDEARKPLSRIAKDIGHTGRGQRRATISKYLCEMYEEQITFYPNLFMKTFEEPKWEAYLLRKNGENIYGTFKQIRAHVSYALYLSGRYDYFVTCKSDTIDFSKYDIEITLQTRLYTPIFTTPGRWNCTFKDAVTRILNFDFRKGRLDRSKNGVLGWDELDYNIFELMKGNGRRKFNEVAKELGVHQTTVKRRFIDNILPNCKFVHYFFPKGYDYYNKTFFLIHSKYEKSLVKAFRLLPCTTYVYPFEKEMGCIIFHRNINDLMSMVEKLKKEKIIDSFSMFTPLRYD